MSSECNTINAMPFVWNKNTLMEKQTNKEEVWLWMDWFENPGSIKQYSVVAIMFKCCNYLPWPTYLLHLELIGNVLMQVVWPPSYSMFTVTYFYQLSLSSKKPLKPPQNEEWQDQSWSELSSKPCLPRQEWFYLFILTQNSYVNKM